MARGAGHIGVPQGKRKSRRAVVKRGRGPTRRSMASRTGRYRKRVRGRGVRRVISLLPGGQVASASSARGRGNGQIVIIVDVASSAGQICVPQGERKSRACEMVETGVQPIVNGSMAVLTLGLKL